MHLPSDFVIGEERGAITQAVEFGRHLFDLAKAEFEVEVSVLRELCEALTPPIGDEGCVDEEKNEKLIEAQLEIEDVEERYRRIGNLVLVHLVSEIEAQLTKWFERRAGSVRGRQPRQSRLDSLNQQYIDKFGVSFKKTPEYADIEELVAARNLVVHEGGIANEDYLRRFPKARLVDEGKILVGKGRLKHCLGIFESFLGRIHNSLPRS